MVDRRENVLNVFQEKKEKKREIEALMKRKAIPKSRAINV